MKKIFLLAALSCCLLLHSCASTGKNEAAKQDDSSAVAATSVPFLEAKNYFVKNNVQPENLVNPKITSQAEFDNIFGMATTMGEQGKPTPIDFSKQYVIALVGKPTDKATTLTATSLTKSGNTITLGYTETVGEKQSYTIQPFLILVVDNQYQGDVKLRAL